MTCEFDTEQVPGFAFLEVCAGIYIYQGWNFSFVAGNLYLENQFSAADGFIGVVDHFEHFFGDKVYASDR